MRHIYYLWHLGSELPGSAQEGIGLAGRYVLKSHRDTQELPSVSAVLCKRET